MSDIKASDVKALRDRTGAGMMDCKKALTEAAGDMDKALEIIRVKFGAKVGKLADREATEGTVQSYVHATGKVGVIIEVDCNTDFVARNDDFIAFAKDIAMHIAAVPDTEYVNETEVPEDVRASEMAIYQQKAAAEGKPEAIQAKIAEGQLKKWMSERVLLHQVHVNQDKYDGKTIEQLRSELSAKTGENVVVRRFTRYAVGA